MPENIIPAISLKAKSTPFQTRNFESAIFSGRQARHTTSTIYSGRLLSNHAHSITISRSDGFPSLPFSRYSIHHL